jgi:hypothetical protein
LCEDGQRWSECERHDREIWLVVWLEEQEHERAFLVGHGVPLYRIGKAAGWDGHDTRSGKWGGFILLFTVMNDNRRLIAPYKPNDTCSTLIQINMYFIVFV